MLNPTGGVVRIDSEGSGFFAAPRGFRRHKGVDIDLPEGPGMEVRAPVPGRVVRMFLCYAGDERFQAIDMPAEVDALVEAAPEEVVARFTDELV